MGSNVGCRFFPVASVCEISRTPTVDSVGEVLPCIGGGVVICHSRSEFGRGHIRAWASRLSRFVIIVVSLGMVREGTC